MYSFIRNFETPQALQKIVVERPLQPAVEPVKKTVLFELPGILIPYPLSQLMLKGIMRIHITPETAAPGFSQLQGCKWIWIIEVHSTSRKEADVKLFDAAQLVPPELLAGFPARPLQSQIIGAVRFGDAVQYCSKPDFDADVQQHLLPASHVAAWGKETSLRWLAHRSCSRTCEAEACQWKLDWGISEAEIC